MNSESTIPPRPSRSLEGRVAIVTGAGCEGNGLGNGRAIALLLAEVGASVVCVDINEEWAEQTARLIGVEGKGAAISVQADVTQEAKCKQVVDTSISRFGRVDILVNNVGIMGAKGAAPEIDIQQWKAGLDVNITSMMLMAKFAVPAMLKNPPGALENKGSIINMGSVAGLQGGTPHLLYPTSKGAVVNMTKAMAAHHSKDGVRVNCVCPGKYYCLRFAVEEITGLI